MRSSVCAQASAAELAILLVAAVSDDVAALAQPVGHDRQAVADKEAVHHVSTGGRGAFRGERRQ